jgi:putative drug exporter of the RND superfamily
MLLGLGLAVDYSLLRANRFREPRAAGQAVAQAVERTAATAGRTVMFSALTVATSLSGLFVFGDPPAGPTSGPRSHSLPRAPVLTTAATLVRCVLVPATMTLLGRANWWAPAPAAPPVRPAGKLRALGTRGGHGTAWRGGPAASRLTER